MDKIKDGKLILSSSQEPRTGWAEAFQEMAKNGDDKLVYPEISNLHSDNEDWEWKGLA